MTRECAIQIAEHFLLHMNGTGWDGNGEKPETVDCRIMTYPYNAERGTELDISYEQTEEGWHHCCELRDSKTGELLEMCHGPGINMAECIAETIMSFSEGEGGEE